MIYTEAYLDKFIEHWWLQKWQVASYEEKRGMILARSLTVDQLVQGMAFLERNYES